MNLKDLSIEEIKDLILKGKVKAKELTDNGICPTCFDKENNGILYGIKDDKMIYEDNLFECFLVGNPRSVGHTIISTKSHYKDMLEIDDVLCQKIFVLARKVMIAIKEVYGAESVYLCTMCDGPMNHFHVQLIPRYAFEDRGSKNFVKPRMKYVFDEEKINMLCEKMKIFNI